MVEWLKETKPDVVMMHLGTNDVWRGIPTEKIIEAYGKMVEQMRGSKRDVKILVNCPVPEDE